MKNNINSTYKNPDVTTLFVKASSVYCTDEFTKFMDELSIVKPKAFEKLIDDDMSINDPVHIVRFDDMT